MMVISCKKHKRTAYIGLEPTEFDAMWGKVADGGTPTPDNRAMIARKSDSCYVYELHRSGTHIHKTDTVNGIKYIHYLLVSK